MFLKKFKLNTKYISLFLVLLNTHLLSGQVLALGTNSSSSPKSSQINDSKFAQAGKVESAPSICPAQLETKINEIVTKPQFSRARWGILVQTLSSSNTLYSRDAQSYFLPASNVKLLTTAAALRQLTPQFRIRTSVYGTGNNLRVVGRGDPSLTDAQLRDLARQIKSQGYTQVERLIVEDSYFKGSVLNPSWEWEDVQAYYGAPINSLILNQNAAVLTLKPQALGQPLQVNWADPLDAIGWQVKNESITTEAKSAATADAGYDFGSPVIKIKGQLPVDAQPAITAVAVTDPARRFLTHLQRNLALEGIGVSQGIVTYDSANKQEKELAAVESLPLANLVMEANQNSNNIYLEAFLRSLGIATQPSDEDNTDSDQLGLAAIKKTLTQFGVNPESYVLKDGSGLSRHNLATPEVFVQTLKAMAQTPEASIYKASLPVAGVSGTLKNRFRNTPAQGIVHAKTGTMSGMSSLSGYIDVPGYEPLAFSIIVNQSDQSVSNIRQAIDQVVILLTRLQRC